MATCIDKNTKNLPGYTETPNRSDGVSVSVSNCATTFGGPPRLLTNSNTACTPVSS